VTTSQPLPTPTSAAMNNPTAATESLTRSWAQRPAPAPAAAGVRVRTRAIAGPRRVHDVEDALVCRLVGQGGLDQPVVLEWPGVHTDGRAGEWLSGTVLCDRPVSQLRANTFWAAFHAPAAPACRSHGTVNETAAGTLIVEADCGPARI
jgi:hypothetical protein